MGKDIKLVLAPETTGSFDNLTPFPPSFLDQQQQIVLCGLNSCCLANQGQVLQSQINCTNANPVNTLMLEDLLVNKFTYYLGKYSFLSLFPELWVLWENLIKVEKKKVRGKERGRKVSKCSFILELQNLL